MTDTFTEAATKLYASTVHKNKKKNQHVFLLLKIVAAVNVISLPAHARSNIVNIGMHHGSFVYRHHGENVTRHVSNDLHHARSETLWLFIINMLVFFWSGKHTAGCSTSHVKDWIIKSQQAPMNNDQWLLTRDQEEMLIMSPHRSFTIPPPSFIEDMDVIAERDQHYAPTNSAGAPYEG
jgi:hypothetical protein